LNGNIDSPFESVNPSDYLFKQVSDDDGLSTLSGVLDSLLDTRCLRLVGEFKDFRKVIKLAALDRVQCNFIVVFQLLFCLLPEVTTLCRDSS